MNPSVCLTFLVDFCLNESIHQNRKLSCHLLSAQISSVSRASSEDIYVGLFSAVSGQRRAEPLQASWHLLQSLFVTV